jgi:hypothetical protein
LAIEPAVECGVPLRPAGSGHHRSIVVASIFSVKLSATRSRFCDHARGNSSAPRQSWPASWRPVRRARLPKVPRKCGEPKADRCKRGPLYQGRQELVAPREFFPPIWTEAKSAEDQLAFAMVKIPRRRSQVSLFCPTWTNSSLFRTMADGVIGTNRSQAVCRVEPSVLAPEGRNHVARGASPWSRACGGS